MESSLFSVVEVKNVPCLNPYAPNVAPRGAKFKTGRGAARSLTAAIAHLPEQSVFDRPLEPTLYCL
jgi:hypothetical protein